MLIEPELITSSCAGPVTSDVKPAALVAAHRHVIAGGVRDRGHLDEAARGCRCAREPVARRRRQRVDAPGPLIVDSRCADSLASTCCRTAPSNTLAKSEHVCLGDTSRRLGPVADVGDRRGSFCRLTDCANPRKSAPADATVSADAAAIAPNAIVPLLVREIAPLPISFDRRLSVEGGADRNRRDQAVRISTFQAVTPCIAPAALASADADQSADAAPDHDRNDPSLAKLADAVSPARSGWRHAVAAYCGRGSPIGLRTHQHVERSGVGQRDRCPPRALLWPSTYARWP